jgi:S1-C subfamily serine protease
MSRTRFLTLAGATLVVVAIIALGVTWAPAVYGQTRVISPIDFQTRVTGGSEIGASLRDVDQADITRERLTSPSGAVVTEVRAEGPAARAGIKAGDIVVRFDGETVRSARHLARLIDETPDGRQVEATVIRAGERVNLRVAPEAAHSLVDLRHLSNLGDRLSGLRDLDERLRHLQVEIPRIDVPDLRLEIDRHLALNPDFAMRFGNRTPGRLGVTLQELTGQLGAYFGVSDGVLVTSVDEGSAASAAGLKAGDVITKVNGEASTSVSELRRRLSASTGDVTLTFTRERREQTVTVKMEPSRVGRTIVK